MKIFDIDTIHPHRPLVFQGYFENPEANARDFDKDGFFHTGDIACKDCFQRQSP